MDSVRFDVHRVLSHELQDVLDAGGVRQTSQADAVTSAAGRGKERRGQDRDGHDGRRRQRGDQGCGHVPVQDLRDTGETRGVIFYILTMKMMFNMSHIYSLKQGSTTVFIQTVRIFLEAGHSNKIKKKNKKNHMFVINI